MPSSRTLSAEAPVGQLEAEEGRQPGGDPRSRPGPRRACWTHTGPQSCFRKSSGDKLAGPSFAGDRSRQQDRCVSFLKLDPPPIQCAARVNSLLTEQSSYNFNSVISFSTFTRRTAYSWQRVQFETTTPAHLLASSVPSETRTAN